MLHTIKIIDVLNSIAGQLHVSPAAVALKWLILQHHQIIPIVGARTVKQLTENLSSLDITLESHHLQMLDEVFKNKFRFSL